MTGKKASTRCRHTLILSALLSLLVSFASGATFVDNDLVEVQVLSVNDFHGSLLPSGTTGGAAYLTTYLRQREAENPHTLIVHAGDMVGASPVVSSLLQDEPTIEVLQLIGFDLGVPGNHEFDEGLAELQRLIHGGRHEATSYFVGMGFPLVLANVVDEQTGDPILPPYAIRVVGGVPLGFIGICTLETTSVVMPGGIANLRFIDPVEAINRWVPELQAKGIEAILVLAHEGGLQLKDGSIIGPVADIARAVADEVDIIISGHTHTYINGQVNGKLIVQAGLHGAAFADIDLVIDKTDGDVVSAQAEIIKVVTTDVDPDPRVAALVTGYEEAVKSLIDRVIAVAAHDITKAQTRGGESALGNLIADSQRHAAGTQLAFMNPGGIRTDLAAGELTWGEAYAIQPFGNNLITFTLTGDQVRRVLNQQWQQQGDQIALRFMQISGFGYSWDDTRPIGDKVVDIWLEDGTPVSPTARYTVVANEFIATGGNNLTVFTEGQDRGISYLDLDAFVMYVQQLAQPFSATVTGRIKRLK
ncbi:MAG: bifunctional metallophosphatase/5'-nucleotidase [Limnochordia bacterium]|jgi:5'-nucleotidase